jgi:fibrillarin-like pre-rRNA processing protein
MKEIQPGIFRQNNKIYTKPASDKAVYGETFIEQNGEKYRNWQPSRSKAGAGVMKGFDLGLKQDFDVLYLGAASGTTVSHFSDILEHGFVFGVEYSDTTARDLVKVAEQRENIVPLLDNARQPENYDDLVPSVDVVFQDISQSDQAEIFIKNCEKFLKEDGIGLFSVKARSISTSRDKDKIFDEVKDKIQKKFEIIEETELEPYEKEHLLLKVRSI